MSNQTYETPPITLTPEQIILWLEGHRQLMHEIWRSNPGSREEWERINNTKKLRE